MARLKLTYEDYVLYPDDGKRRQLIDGEVYVVPAPNRRHQEIVLRLSTAFQNHVAGRGDGEVYAAPIDVILTEVDVVQPDVLYVAPDRYHVLADEGLRGAPTIAVEVVSGSTARMDRALKRDLYARHGVLEYWIVDPDADWVEVFRLQEGAYGRPEILEPPDVLTTPLLPGFEVSLAELLDRSGP